MASSGVCNFFFFFFFSSEVKQHDFSFEYIPQIISHLKSHGHKELRNTKQLSVPKKSRSLPETNEELMQLRRNSQNLSHLRLKISDATSVTQVCSPKLLIYISGCLSVCVDREIL